MPNINEMKKSNFFSGKALAAEGKAHLLTVQGVQAEKLGDNNDTELEWVVRFMEHDQGLVLNSNAKIDRFADAMGSDNTEDWPGRKVVIYPGKTSFQGRQVDCVAWRKPKPGAKEPEPVGDVNADDFSDDDIPF